VRIIRMTTKLFHGLVQTKSKRIRKPSSGLVKVINRMRIVTHLLAWHTREAEVLPDRWKNLNHPLITMHNMKTCIRNKVLSTSMKCLSPPRNQEHSKSF
jgi:hypothetical protein